MTAEQWDRLINVIDGTGNKDPVTGFIVDSPWIPGWYGISALDYYSSDDLWLKSNLKIHKTFPDIIFIPGFWSEFGMITESSAFGAPVVWEKRSLPFVKKIINSIEDISLLEKPDPAKDGMLPLIINRLKLNEKKINSYDHYIKFAIARGPLNIASYLMGTTELMLAVSTHPEKVHELLKLINSFLLDWLKYQKEMFPGIDGIFILDDIVGFLGEHHIKEFFVPYFKSIFNAFDARIKLFHNDAHGLVCAPYLKEAGVNMFNFSFKHSIQDIQEKVGEEIVLVGNIPPRDVLAAGLVNDVEKAVENAWKTVKRKERIIWSCGGGMPPDVSTENIIAFAETIKKLNNE